MGCCASTNASSPVTLPATAARARLVQRQSPQASPSAPRQQRQQQRRQSSGPAQRQSAPRQQRQQQRRQSSGPAQRQSPQASPSAPRQQRQQQQSSPPNRSTMYQQQMSTTDNDDWSDMEDLVPSPPPDAARGNTTAFMSILKEISEQVSSKCLEVGLGKADLSPCICSNSSQECLSLRRFRLGLQACGFNDLASFLADSSNFELCTHGTKSFRGIEQICCNGWDTTYRSGQVYGRGEYFDRGIDTSSNYTDTGVLIVSLIVAPDVSGGKVRSENSDQYVVVDNDSDNGASYCLPLTVAIIGQSLPGQALPEFDDCPAARVARPATHRAEYRDWRTGHWLPFSQADVAAMQRHHAQGSDVLWTTDYRFTIDLQNCTMTPISGNTSHTVSIRFVHEPLVEFLEATGQWKRYDAADSAQVVSAFASGLASFQLGAASGATYNISFAQMTQTNIHFNTVRRIRFV